MSTWKRYPEYKPWRGSWLTEVPSHWLTASLRHFASFSTGWTPPTDVDASYEGSHLWANISDLGPRWIDTTVKSLSDEAVVGRRASAKGDLLFSFKLSVGTVSRAQVPMFTNEAIATFRAGPEFDLAYAYYALPVFVTRNANTNIYGALLLNAALIKSAPYACPASSEQRVIAGFLDHETSKIDALIEKQYRRSRRSRSDVSP